MHFSSLVSTSLLAASLAYAQQAPAPAAVTIKPGPAVANQGAGAAASAAASSAAPAMGLGGSATAGAPPASNTAGVIAQSGSVPVWVIKVADDKNDIVFSPNSVTAKVGEMVQFQFYSKVSDCRNISSSA
jgi:hypothetical protein